MKKNKLLLILVALACVLVIPFRTVFAADHGDSPQVRFDPRLDILDLYAFQSPANPANTVIIVTFSPLAGFISPATFNADARYEILVDNTGDAIQDIGFIVTFDRPTTSGQRFTLNGTNALHHFVVRGVVGQALSLPGGSGQFLVKRFDDPFFFDVEAFKRGLAFTDPGDNFFKDWNANAFVLEMPSALLGQSNVGIWAVTRLGDRQIDRNGRPAINTALIPAAQKDAFNAGVPANDRQDFRDTVINTLTNPPFNRTAPDAAALADFLLPDILTINTASAAGFPNGRRLADDVIDIELQLLSGNPNLSDHVDNDVEPFLNAFPYLKPANP